MLKQAKFWLPIVYAAVILFNVSGADDYNIVLFLTSPPLWLHEASVTVRSYVRIPLAGYYLITLLFWLIAGWGIDGIVNKLRMRNRNGNV